MTPARAVEFWTDRKVRWYQRALERSDYAAAVLGALEAVLAGCRSALDVGAGCGALTLPLARRLERVTALEPAPAMASALRAAATAQGLRHVEVIEAAWDDARVEPHDLVLCAHVGELSRPGAPFLREAPRLARRAIALVRDATRDGDKFFFRELYPRLCGRPYGAGGDHAETIDELRRLGVAPTVRLVDYRSDQPFDDLDEACDFWQEYMGVEGEPVRLFLWSFLARRLTPEPDGWVAPYPKQAAVIWWPAAGVE